MKCTLTLYINIVIQIEFRNEAISQVVWRSVNRIQALSNVTRQTCLFDCENNHYINFMPGWLRRIVYRISDCLASKSASSKPVLHVTCFPLNAKKIALTIFPSSSEGFGWIRSYKYRFKSNQRSSRTFTP